MACFPLTHKWVTVEAIGKVHHQRCSKCGNTRVRVK